MQQPTPITVNTYEAASWARHRWHFLTRIRYQLLGGMLVGVVLPAAVRSGFDPNFLNPGSLSNTYVGTFLAMLLGAYLTRRMAAYPGIAPASAVLPAFAIAFGVALAVFFFWRIDYSRFLFGASFVLVVFWFGFIGLIEPRLRRPRLLLVPAGDAENLLVNAEADWLLARSANSLPDGISGVVADFRADLATEWQQLLARAALAGLPVYHWKQIAEALTGTVDIEHLSENNLGSLLSSSAYLRVKPLLDFTAAIVSLPASVLVALPVALAILVFDGRPIFFRQERIGFRGLPFTMLKFRTMRSDADKGLAFTEDGDQRITPLGRFLRRYRLDELPQIVNILKGEMSWIGPRPESLKLAEWYESEVPFYNYRHIVRPGISGWAQVHQGNVAKIKAATGKLRYDFYYIKHFSPWLDILITAKTFRTVLTGFGAR